MTEILETSGLYRLCLEIMEDGYSFNPRTNQDCNLANVITPTQRDYFPVDEDGGPLQYGWDHFSLRADSEKLFIRWARVFYGVTVVEHRPHDGPWSLWYVMPDKAAESTWEPEKIIESEIKEYEAWARGEVYAYVIERKVTWVPKEGQDTKGLPAELTTWEHEDSCGGYIGRKFAEEAAREAFDAYKEK